MVWITYTANRLNVPISATGQSVVHSESDSGKLNLLDSNLGSSSPKFSRSLQCPRSQADCGTLTMGSLPSKYNKEKKVYIFVFVFDKMFQAMCCVKSDKKKSKYLYNFS